MSTEKHIEQEIERTLASLDHVQRASANPFLITRIQARLRKQSGFDKAIGFFSRPAYALAFLLVIVVVNALVLFGSYSTETTPAEPIATTDMADEYTLAVSTEYEY